MRARRREGVTDAAEQLDRPLEAFARLRGPAAPHGEPPGLDEERRLHLRLVRCQRRRLVEMALRLLGRGQRGGPLARLDECRPGPGTDLRHVGVVAGRSRRSEQMRCDHLRHVLVGAVERALEGVDRGEMPRLAVAARERLVRDLAQKLLQEAVLPALGPARIRLERQHLLAHERTEDGLELVGAQPGERGDRALGERLAENADVLDELPLLGGEAVEPRGRECMERLRHLERLDLGGRPVDGAVLREEAAIEQHPDRLDGVQRHALRPGEHLRLQVVGQAGDVALEEPAHLVVGERLERQIGRVPDRAPEVGLLVGELGPRRARPRRASATPTTRAGTR